ncbi:hypothetical protein DPMN_103097 [Dreissena polymorpha]|uniref:Uncharacterized protein n=1 Tax=Dreissena polymorpha TaxID=45954 RepID=A0A9D4K285_DREPO|nr:hypothetical protein DPMN_103097 [Dreissena polymorpha]
MDYWMDYAVIDAKPFLYYLQYMSAIDAKKKQAASSKLKETPMHLAYVRGLTDIVDELVIRNQWSTKDAALLKISHAAVRARRKDTQKHPDIAKWVTVKP